MNQTPAPTVPTVAANGIVSTTHPLAAQIGIDVLQSGGNAIDAAIATNAAMGLMEPMSCGIGGDLFAIVYWAADRKLYGLNASGRSPARLNIPFVRGMGLEQLPSTGPLSWSVPGCVDGWDQLLKRFGTQSLAQLIAPTIKYAETGFEVPPFIAQMWAGFETSLKACPTSAATYLPNGRARAGETFHNTRLAQSYRELASGGRDAFYRGILVRQMVEFSGKSGGHFSLDDFSAHTSSWVDPVSTDYRGTRVWELPPPGQGISVLQMLNILEGFDLSAMGPDSPDWWHLFIEAKKLAYADRARHYADPEFVDVPTDWLISKAYGAERRKLIRMDRAMDSVEAGKFSGDTVYLCVVDKDRNCVSLIQSNAASFGSGIVPGELGFVFQNRGASFALDPAHPNCLQPRKRPFHTIIPSMVTRNDLPFFVFGVMGGDMQPQGQVQVLVNGIDFGMNVYDAGAAPRMDHTGSASPTGVAPQESGKISVEKAIRQEIVNELRRRGHRIEYGPPNRGGYQGIVLDRFNGKLLGASEPRRDGRAIGY